MPNNTTFFAALILISGSTLFCPPKEEKRRTAPRLDQEALDLPAAAAGQPEEEIDAQALKVLCKEALVELERLMLPHGRPFKPKKLMELVGCELFRSSLNPLLAQFDFKEADLAQTLFLKPELDFYDGPVTKISIHELVKDFISKRFPLIIAAAQRRASSFGRASSSGSLRATPSSGSDRGSPVNTPEGVLVNTDFELSVVPGN